MLFMTVFTYPPEKRNEIIKQRIEKGSMIPAGIKLLGEWSDIAGGRVFRLVELATDDLMVLLASTRAWSDLGKIEIVPVVETEQAIKAALQ